MTWRYKHGFFAERHGGMRRQRWRRKRRVETPLAVCEETSIAHLPTATRVIVHPAAGAQAHVKKTHVTPRLTPIASLPCFPQFLLQLIPQAHPTSRRTSALVTIEVVYCGFGSHLYTC